MILFLDEERVRACLSYDELIPALEQALIDFSSGMSCLAFIQRPGARIGFTRLD